MRCTLMDACWLQPKSTSCSKRKGTGSVSLASQERSLISHRHPFFGSFTYAIISAATGHQIVTTFRTDCTILDPVSLAQRISNTFRSTQGVDIVIALTHMHLEEDVHLAQHCDTDIDLVLGGHDHGLAVHGTNMKAIDDRTFEGHIQLVKSGTDFKSFNAIRMHLTRMHGKASVRSIRGWPPSTAFSASTHTNAYSRVFFQTVHQTRDITLADNLPDDSGIHTILTKLQTRIADTVSKPLFHATVPLDGREKSTWVICSQTQSGHTTTPTLHSSILGVCDAIRSSTPASSPSKT